MLDTLFAIRPDAFGHLKRFILQPHKGPAEDGQRRGLPLRVSNGLAVVEIVGPMMKGPAWIEEYGLCSTNSVEAAVHAALMDAEVHRIVLSVDTPGGSTAGLTSLSDTIYAGRDVKPIHGYVSDQATSAGYEVVSQCTTITASRGAWVGSIGVMMALMLDDPEEVAIFTSGEMKWPGADGKITDAQREYLQGLIDTEFASFGANVLRARSMSAEQFAKVADGRIVIGEDALDLGLIDEIKPWRQFLAEQTAEAAGEAARMEASGRRTQRVRKARMAGAICRLGKG